MLCVNLALKWPSGSREIDVKSLKTDRQTRQNVIWKADLSSGKFAFFQHLSFPNQYSPYMIFFKILNIIFRNFSAIITLINI